MKTPKTHSTASRKRMIRPPVTDQYVADELDAMATLMLGVAKRMKYIGGFNGEMSKHANELAGAATIARGWAKAIRAKRSNNDQSLAQMPAPIDTDS